MQHEVPHQLSIATARLVAQKAVQAYGEKFQKYNFESKWEGEDRVDLSFEIKGKALNGSMSVTPSAFVFDLDIPLVFRVFKGMAIDILDRETKVWIEKAENGELEAG